MQLIPIGNSIITCGRSTSQGRGDGSFPLFQFVVVYSQGKGAFCGTDRQDGLDQMLGRTTTITTCNVSAGSPSGGTGSGSATPDHDAHHDDARRDRDHRHAEHDRAADHRQQGGPAEPGRGHARTRPSRRSTTDDLGTYQELVEEARTLVPRPQNATSAPLTAGLTPPGLLGSAPGLLLSA